MSDRRPLSPCAQRWWRNHAAGAAAFDAAVDAPCEGGFRSGGDSQSGQAAAL